MSLIEKIVEIRAESPDKIAQALNHRVPGAFPGSAKRKIMIVAADHPARGALAAGSNIAAMASRKNLLERCQLALSRPEVSGFLGTADVVEDLTVLGALEKKCVFGSMNRGGLSGAAFEMDDRFTGYTSTGIVESGLNGGKILLRVNLSDPGTANTLESTAKRIDELANQGLVAMVEPFISRRDKGTIVNDLSTDAVIKSVAIASGLGKTSAYTWLKLPCVPEMERVAEASSLPILILGGDISESPQETLDDWARALSLPAVKGVVIGRSVLYPPNMKVSEAIDQVIKIL